MTAIMPTEPVAAAQRTFRTLLNAMANPGTVHLLEPRPGETPEEAIAFALCDHEVTFAVVDEPEQPVQRGAVPVARRIALRTGSVEVEIGAGAFVFAYAPLGDDRWREVRRGTLAYPDGGATVVYVLPAVGAGPLALTLTLTLVGPGIETAQRLSLAGFERSEIAARDRACEDYPMGVDCVFVDGAGRVACLPRSTSVQIEEA